MASTDANLKEVIVVAITVHWENSKTSDEKQYLLMDFVVGNNSMMLLTLVGLQVQQQP